MLESIKGRIMSLFINNKKFVEYAFKKEQELEDIVVAQHKTLFGENTIYIDAKKKINSGELGKTIPDGLLFDFADSCYLLTCPI